jgi:hypothetical protein
MVIMFVDIVERGNSMDKEECESLGRIWVSAHQDRRGNYIHSYCREKSKRERERHVNEHAKVFLRYQHSVGSSKGFGGPDVYVAVVTAPKNVPIPDNMPLREDSLKKRSMKIKYFGEGYSKHQGSRSSLGRATREAEEYAERINRRR